MQARKQAIAAVVEAATARIKFSVLNTQACDIALSERSAVQRKVHSATIDAHVDRVPFSYWRAK